MAERYSVAEVIRGQLQRSAPAETNRDIETITAEIIRLKQDAGSAILGIGDRLIEAKAMMSHGEWLPWLMERVEFSESTAQRFMRLSREWRNPSALTDLGATKALTLLALPPEEREAFMSENHLVDGQEKSVVDMTSRELEKAIRERDEAQKAAEAARAEALTAEESRSKMEADMAALKELHRIAQESEREARDALAAAERDLYELQERPVDVAVETVVDQEAIEKARAAAIAEMQARVDQAEKARMDAEKLRQNAEKALLKANKDIAANDIRASKAEQELAEARRQLEAAGKAGAQSAISSDADLASFKLLLDQAVTILNQMLGLHMKIQGRDAESGEKCRRALIAYFDEGRKRVE